MKMEEDFRETKLALLKVRSLERLPNLHIHHHIKLRQFGSHQSRHRREQQPSLLAFRSKNDSDTYSIQRDSQWHRCAQGKGLLPGFSVSWLSGHVLVPSHGPLSPGCSELPYAEHHWQSKRASAPADPRLNPKWLRLLSVKLIPPYCIKPNPDLIVLT